jgi:hypothetical protein
MPEGQLSKAISYVGLAALRECDAFGEKWRVMRWGMARDLARVVFPAGCPIRFKLIYLFPNTHSIMQAHTLHAPRLLLFSVVCSTYTTWRYRLNLQLLHTVHACLYILLSSYHDQSNAFQCHAHFVRSVTREKIPRLSNPEGTPASHWDIRECPFGRDLMFWSWQEI